jgi:hypothetical protein
MDFSPLDWRQFEELCKKMLESVNYEVSRADTTDGADFFAKRPGSEDVWLVECKHFQSSNQKLARTQLRRASDWLAGKKAKEPNLKLMLITSLDLSPEVEASLHQRGLDEVWDLSVISQILNNDEKLRTRVEAVIRELALLSTPSAPEYSKKSDELLKSLASIQPGRTASPDYERVCTQILSELFVPPLRFLGPQLRSDDGLDIRDALFGFGKPAPFWDQVASHYRTRFVVAEFKNYTDPIGQKEVESIAQYLWGNALRNFGLLCTRLEPSDSALKARRRAWLETSKLIIILTDEDFAEMLLLKDKEEVPTDVLEGKLDDFLLGLVP